MSRTLEIIRTLRTTPPLPSVSLRVLDLVRDPEFEIDELVDLVRTDPSLTARVLKLTNSALLALTSEVTSVADAVAFIGTRNLVKLVLVCCSANHFRDARASIYGSPVDLWRQTFALATAAQWIATHCGRLDSGTAFTAGILHNIGKVTLSQILADESTDVLPASIPFFEREVQLLGIDHAAAAGIIADHWGLPSELIVPLRDHHDLDAVANGPRLLAALAAAEGLTLTMGIGAVREEEVPPCSQAACERLGLAQGDLGQAVADVMDELERHAELLNLEGWPGR